MTSADFHEFSGSYFAQLSSKDLRFLEMVERDDEWLAVSSTQAPDRDTHFPNKSKQTEISDNSSASNELGGIESALNAAGKSLECSPGNGNGRKRRLFDSDDSHSFSHVIEAMLLKKSKVTTSLSTDGHIRDGSDDCFLALMQSHAQQQLRSLRTKLQGRAKSLLQYSHMKFCAQVLQKRCCGMRSLFEQLHLSKKLSQRRKEKQGVALPNSSSHGLHYAVDIEKLLRGFCVDVWIENTRYVGIVLAWHKNRVSPLWSLVKIKLLDYKGKVYVWTPLHDICFPSTPSKPNPFAPNMSKRDLNEEHMNSSAAFHFAEFKYLSEERKPDFVVTIFDARISADVVGLSFPISDTPESCAKDDCNIIINNSVASSLDPRVHSRPRFPSPTYQERHSAVDFRAEKVQDRFGNTFMIGRGGVVRKNT